MEPNNRLNILIIDDDEDDYFTPQSFIRIAASSTQYLVASISDGPGTLGFNPLSYPVNFAFIAGPAQPQSGDWHTGAWTSNNPDGPYTAQVLIGPANGGLVIAPGSYQVWAEVVTSSQNPVIQIGTLQIY